jgi:hypothetical protein
MSRVKSWLPAVAGLTLLLGVAAQARAQIESIDSIEVDPRLPTSADSLAVIVEGDGCGFFNPFVDGDRIFIHPQFICDPPVSFHFRTRVEVGFLEAGTYTILVVKGEDDHVAHVVTVAPAQVHARLLDRFDAEIRFRDPFGPPGTVRRAQAVALSERAAFFWFFDADLPEVTLKMIDGGPVNGHIWLFAASTTDVEFTLRVTDSACAGDALPPPPCTAVVEYASPPSTNRNIIDLDAFPSVLP